MLTEEEIREVWEQYAPLGMSFEVFLSGTRIIEAIATPAQAAEVESVREAQSKVGR